MEVLNQALFFLLASKLHARTCFWVYSSFLLGRGSLFGLPLKGNQKETRHFGDLLLLRKARFLANQTNKMTTDPPSSQKGHLGILDFDNDLGHVRVVEGSLEWEIRQDLVKLPHFLHLEGGIIWEVFGTPVDLGRPTLQGVVVRRVSEKVDHWQRYHQHDDEQGHLDGPQKAGSSTRI